MGAWLVTTAPPWTKKREHHTRSWGGLDDAFLIDHTRTRRINSPNYLVLFNLFSDFYQKGCKGTGNLRIDINRTGIDYITITLDNILQVL